MHFARTLHGRGVLPPDNLPRGWVWPVLCKLLHNACERLRAESLLRGLALNCALVCVLLRSTKRNIRRWEAPLFTPIY